MDSGWVRLYVDDELVQTLYWSDSDKIKRELSFMVTSENDQEVRVEYAVYYQGIALIQGSDMYHPDSPKNPRQVFCSGTAQPLPKSLINSIAPPLPRLLPPHSLPPLLLPCKRTLNG